VSFFLCQLDSSRMDQVGRQLSAEFVQEPGLQSRSRVTYPTVILSEVEGIPRTRRRRFERNSGPGESSNRKKGRHMSALLIRVNKTYFLGLSSFMISSTSSGLSRSMTRWTA
jgi:hypothetical protein